jgi:hypothetical protein
MNAKQTGASSYSHQASPRRFQHIGRLAASPPTALRRHAAKLKHGEKNLTLSTDFFFLICPYNSAHFIASLTIFINLFS